MFTKSKFVRLIGILLVVMIPLGGGVFSTDDVVHAQTNAGNPVQVYFNDFDGGAIVIPGVTATLGGITSLESVQGYDGYGFGGDFLRNGTGSYDYDNMVSVPGSPTTLTLTGLPPHTAVDINFLLAVIDSWDGGDDLGGCCSPDILNVTVDGNTVFSESFGFINPSFVPPPGVLLAEYMPLGVNPDFDDSAYNMGLNPAFDGIPHSASTLTIEWFASGDGWQGGYDESWAIDNLEVIIDAGIEVDLDIKPGSDPNSINCENEKEVITVAVLTTEDFDVLTIDHTTVTFEGASETHVKKTGELQRHMEDVDLDGDMDLVFHFRLGNTTVNCGSVAGTLTGRTYDGIPVMGSDSIRMVKVGDCGYTPDSAGLSCQDILDRCPGTPSGEKWIEPDGMNAILAYCSMDEEGNGWTLIYNRNNAYFSPDHMYNELPAQGPDFSTNSTSWFIPIDATRWLWEVSIDSGASYRTLETSIPLEARSTTHATVENAPIITVYENTTGASSPFYFQTITFLDKCLYGCDSGQASWWGIVNVSQGTGDQENPGLGGHTDWCSMNSMLLPGDNYTWDDGDLEYYLSDWKDIGGDGIGGTNCNPWYPTTQYRYRFWAR